MVDGPARPSDVSTHAPVNPNDIAPVRTQTLSATTLPAVVYHDPEIFAWEREKWFAGGWHYVGREIDLPEKGVLFPD